MITGSNLREDVSISSPRTGSGRVAGIVRRQQAAGHEVAVVVSAMAGETDRLVNFCREANALYDPAEYDVVVASGEKVSGESLAGAIEPA